MLSQILSTCEDGVQNGLETDTDCGGDCIPCGVTGFTTVPDPLVDGVEAIISLKVHPLFRDVSVFLCQVHP